MALGPFCRCTWCVHTHTLFYSTYIRLNDCACRGSRLQIAVAFARFNYWPESMPLAGAQAICCLQSAPSMAARQRTNFQFQQSNDPGDGHHHQLSFWNTCSFKHRPVSLDRSGSVETYAVRAYRRCRAHTVGTRRDRADEGATARVSQSPSRAAAYIYHDA